MLPICRCQDRCRARRRPTFRLRCRSIAGPASTSASTAAAHSATATGSILSSAIRATSMSAGALVGGTVGANYQIGQFVLGVEGDGDWQNLDGTTSGGSCAGVGCETKSDWLATVRGRAGYAWDRVLFYGTCVRAELDRQDRESVRRSAERLLPGRQLRQHDDQRLAQREHHPRRHQLQVRRPWGLRLVRPCFRKPQSRKATQAPGFYPGLFVCGANRGSRPRLASACSIRTILPTTIRHGGQASASLCISISPWTTSRSCSRKSRGRRSRHLNFSLA